MTVETLEPLKPGLSDALLFSAFISAQEADPLKGYRHACEAARKMVEFSAEVKKWWSLDIAYRAGNGSGKTAAGAALGIALARGERTLGGTILPAMPCPNVGWVLVQTRLQQVEASQAAYLKWIGTWPHKISYVQGEGKGYIERIDIATRRCNHGSDERCPTCSRIIFHCAESKSSVGGRIHWAHADELPPADIWDEVCSRFSAGVPFLRFLTYTPLYRREWAWVEPRFKNCAGKIVDGRVEVRASIRDNVFIPQEQVEAQVKGWMNGPVPALARARIEGDYVDIEGDPAFDLIRLAQWKERCRPPLETWEITVQAETTTADGRVVEPKIIRVQVWERPDEEESYLGVADPSLGIQSPMHDPAGWNFYGRRSRKLVCRFNGYLEPYGLGHLGAILSKRYNDAMVDVDQTGGYGLPTVRALSDYGCTNFARDFNATRLRVSSGLGFKISVYSRADLMSAMVRAIAEQSVDIPSAEVIESLSATVLDERGVPIKAPGRHIEDVICSGRAIHLMDLLGKPPARTVTSGERLQQLLRREGFSLEREEEPEAVEDLWS